MLKLYFYFINVPMSFEIILKQSKLNTQVLTYIFKNKQ